MTVNDNVYRILFHASEVDFSEDRHGRSIKNVRQVGGDHGPAPTVGKSAFSGLIG